MDASSPPQGVKVTSTQELILDGAIRALGRRGPEKLSMTDVCEHAGVSRGTLYRYFRSKEDVLEAVGRHVESGVEAAIVAAARSPQGEEDRLQAVLKAFVSHGAEYPETSQTLEAEPAFVLAFVRQALPRYAEIITTEAGDVVAQTPAVRNGTTTVARTVDLLLLLTGTHYFVPHPNPQRLVELTLQMPGLAPDERAGAATTSSRSRRKGS